MKIALVGCGALGGYYGARLCVAGHETHFLLRSDYEAVRARGVQIRSAHGDFTAHPHCARGPQEIGPCDLVVIGLKTTANDQFAHLLPPLVGAHTAVLTLQNGLGNEEALARLFPVDQILGGLCFVCLNRLAPGVIQHLAHGRIVLGEFQRPAGTRTHTLAKAFRAAGVPCDVTDRLAEAHWQKLVWNIAFNGLGVASAAGRRALLEPDAPPALGTVLDECLTTDRLLASPDWTLLVRELMLEVIAVSRALGHQMPDHYADYEISRTREMGAYRASTLIDFERQTPLELEALFLEPLRQARAARVATPRLESLSRVLVALAEQPRQTRSETH
jgi:2-dehydropantoate 2-reductase